MPDLTLADLVDGIVQIGDTMIHVVAMTGVGEVLLRAIDECVPHIRAHGLHACSLLLCESLSTQIINAFLGSSCFDFKYMASLSVIEHTHILMASSD